MSTLKVTNLQHPSSSSNNITFNSDGTVTGVADWIDGTSISTSGSSSYSFTGLPSNVREIVLTVENVSWSASTNLKFRLRTGGSDFTSGVHHSRYQYLGESSMYTGGGTGNTAFIVGGWGSSSHEVSGRVRFTKSSGTKWLLSAQFNTRAFNEGNLLTGDVDIGGTLDGVTILVDTGTLDGGSFNIHYITS